MKEVLKEIAGDLAQFAGLEPDALASFEKEDGKIDEGAVKAFREKAREGFNAKLKSKDEEAAQKATAAFDRKAAEFQSKLLSEREERILKTLKIDKKLRGEELDNFLAEQLSKASKATGLDEDAIERSPFFQKFRQEQEDKVKQVESEWKSKYETRESEIKERDTRAMIWSDAVPKIEDMNPKFDPDSDAVRKDQWDRIQSKLFDRYRYEKQDGRTLVLDKEGKVAKDELGNPIAFEALLSEIVKTTVGVKASEDRKGSGNKGSSGNTSGYQGKMPETEKEYGELMFSTKLSLTEKQALKEAWEKRTGKAA